jgi:cell division protein FtsB
LIADFDKVHGLADPEAMAAERARLTGGSSDAGAVA